MLQSQREVPCVLWQSNGYPSDSPLPYASKLNKENKQCGYNVTSWCGGKTSFTYSGCVSVALGIQHAMRMRPIIRSVARPAQHFSTLSHKRHYIRKIRKNVIEDKTCVFYFLYNFCLKYFSF
jgi:hypothetical protein